MRWLRVTAIVATLGVTASFCAALVWLGPRAGGPGLPTGGAPSPTPTATPGPPPVAPADLAVSTVRPVRMDSLADLGLPATPLDPPPVVAAARFAWEVVEVAVTDALTVAQREALRLDPLEVDRPLRTQWSELAEPLRAGPGRELVVAWLRRPLWSQQRNRTGIELTVLVDGEPRRTIDRTDRTRIGIVVVNVPAGTDPVLEITDGPQPGSDREPESRSVNLRTGEPVGEQRPADVLRQATIRLGDAFQVSGLTPPGTGDGAGCDVRLEPAAYLPGRGYAEPGQMWLRVRVTVSFGAYEDWMAAGHATIEVDLAGSVTVAGEDGRPLPLDFGSRVTGEPRYYPPGTNDLFSVVVVQTRTVPVPETWRQFTATFRLRATFTAENGSRLPYQRYDHQNVGTATLPEIG